MSAAVPEEFHAFLAERRNAIVSVARGEDRAPHATPVWFIYEDGCFRISITRRTLKYRLIQRAPQISLTIDDPVDFRTVIAEGRAEFSDDDESLLRLAHQLRRLYRPGRPEAPDGEVLRGLRAEDRVVLTVVPERVKAWGV